MTAPTPQEVAEKLEAALAVVERFDGGRAIQVGLGTYDSKQIAISLRDLRAAAALLREMSEREKELREALKPFAESLVAQTNVGHQSQDWREETDDTVVNITTSHQRKGMPYLAPDHTLWVGAFRRAAALLPPQPEGA